MLGTSPVELLLSSTLDDFDLITREEVRRTLGNGLADGVGTLPAAGTDDEDAEEAAEECEIVNLGYSEKRTLLDEPGAEDSVSETKSGLDSEERNGGRLVRMRWKPVSGLRTVTTLRLLESTGAELIGVVGLVTDTVDEWCRSTELMLDSSGGVVV